MSTQQDPFYLSRLFNGLDVTDHDVLERIIDRTGPAFGLRGFPGKVFRICARRSYIDIPMTGGLVPQLVVQVKRTAHSADFDTCGWDDFTRTTPAELEAEWTLSAVTNAALPTFDPYLASYLLATTDCDGWALELAEEMELWGNKPGNNADSILRASGALERTLDLLSERDNERQDLWHRETMAREGSWDCDSYNDMMGY